MTKFIHLALFSLFLSACGTREKSDALRLMIWGDASELSAVQSFVRGFEQSHPGTQVRIFSVNPTDYNQSLQSLYLKKQSPDVFYVSRDWASFYAHRGMLQDLSTFIDADREFDFNDFYPAVRDSFLYKGRPYAVAKDFTTMVLYYNEDLFKKAGVGLPNSKWTWSDLRSAAMKLTRDADNDGAPEQYGFAVDTWLGWMMPWIWQAGGDFLDEKGEKGVAGVTPYFEQNVRAFQFLYDLIHKDKCAPDAKVVDQVGIPSLFIGGKLAMCVYGRWACLNFKEIRDFRWNVAPLPRNKNKATVVLTVGYGISSRTKKPNDAWELVKHLTGIEGQTQVAQSGLAVPARKSVAQSPQFLRAPFLPAFVDNRVFLETIGTARFAPSPLEWPQMEDAYNVMTNLIFRQNRPVNESVSEFQRKLETIFH